jgi:CRISPR-associated protein Cmr2
MTTPYLLALSIGPIQEFIAAARRTRDLWCGSHMLSEISRAAAKAVQSAGGELIFPASESIGRSHEGIANIILAELPGGKEVKDIAEKAKQAAKQKWSQFAQDALQPCQKDGNSVD